MDGWMDGWMGWSEWLMARVAYVAELFPARGGSGSRREWLVSCNPFECATDSRQALLIQV
eukprot:363999-Chlamydomonas_euryale.AAC.9